MITFDLNDKSNSSFATNGNYILVMRTASQAKWYYLDTTMQSTNGITSQVPYHYAAQVID